MMGYPKINKALRFTTLGEDLEIVEKEVPPLPANEILVKVHAASINPVDIQLWRSGIVGVVSGEKGMGRDFSGSVVSVGEKVKEGWAEGDEIFGLLFQVFGQGTFSEYISVNPSSDPVARKPTCLTHEQAASIPLVALTAYTCLEWLPPVSTKQRRVIIRGASGGTGSWLVQLAKQACYCHVTAICSSKNSTYVKSLGADEVIDYTTQDVLQSLRMSSTANSKYDLLVDCVGGTDLIPAYETLVHRTGAYVTIVGDKTNIRSLGGPLTYLFAPSQILRYIKGYIWGPRYACVSLLTKSEYLEKVAGLAERGEVKIEVQETLEGALYPSDEGRAWKKACDLMAEGRVRGKVVLKISQ